LKRMDLRAGGGGWKEIITQVVGAAGAVASASDRGVSTGRRSFRRWTGMLNRRSKNRVR